MSTNFELGVQMCHALGLDPGHVQSIVIRWTAHDLPRARVTLVDLDDKEIVRTVARYRLEPLS